MSNTTFSVERDTDCEELEADCDCLWDGNVSPRRCEQPQTARIMNKQFRATNTDRCDRSSCKEIKIKVGQKKLLYLKQCILVIIFNQRYLSAVEKFSSPIMSHFRKSTMKELQISSSL